MLRWVFSIVCPNGYVSKFLVLMWMLGLFCENDFLPQFFATVIVLSLFYNKQFSFTAFAHESIYVLVRKFSWWMYNPAQEQVLPSCWGTWVQSRLGFSEFLWILLSFLICRHNHCLQFTSHFFLFLHLLKIFVQMFCPSFFRFWRIFQKKKNFNLENSSIICVSFN